jgi:hypothetical protein
VHSHSRNGLGLGCLKAKREIADALREIDEAERVTVHVIHVDEVEKASFKESVRKTLNEVWAKSYDELHITREPDDIFQTDSKPPKSLMSYLGLTLKQAREEHVIDNYHFGIVSKTGGA